MRIVFLALVAALLAGCATAPVNTPASVIKVIDQKTNMVRTATAKPVQSEFVGTSASQAKAAPSWYRYGHP